ncbi:MAG: DUF4397 domain-containing protein [Gemmatimonadetes bacterium]|nr:DUF4397 domain-containing protein [Gemmatimonadota bacterium]
MNRYRSLFVLAASVLSASCDKTAVQDITGPETGTRVKFFNFGVSAPGVNFYANTTKMTAISSTSGVESTTGVNSGGVGNGGLYSSIAPGQYSLEGKIAATTDKDLAITKVTATLADAKAYSFYISGIYSTSTKSADGFVVEDPLPATIDFTQASVRFVNAISNSQPMVLYARSTVTGTEVAIGGSVAYKAAGVFTNVEGANYDLFVRAPGSSTNLITRTGVSFNNGRMYTIGARGDMTVTGTTSALRPQLDNTTNR